MDSVVAGEEQKTKLVKEKIINVSPYSVSLICIIPVSPSVLLCFHT